MCGGLTMGIASAGQPVLPIEMPGPAAPTSGPELLPFPAPLAEPDITKIPAPPVGSKMVAMGLGKVLAIGTKGSAILEPRIVDPIPPDLVPGAPKVEIRPDAHRAAAADAADYAVFMQTAHRPDDSLTKLVVFVKIFASSDGRLAACGFYLREPTRPDMSSHDRFLDPRSYLEIGSLARLPTNFMADVTPKYVGEVPGPLETILDRRQDSARIFANCVTSNIAWNPAYAAQPLNLHLQFPAFRYELSIQKSYMRP